MKSMFIAAAAALVLIASGAATAPFPQPKSSSVVATQLTYSSVQYTVAAGGRISFPVPVTNRPIHLMVACITQENRGVGSVTLLRASGGVGASFQRNFFVWTGSDFASNDGGNVNPAVPVDEGSGWVKGDHIMYADQDARVDVVVNSAQSLAIANNFVTPQVVVVTMMY